MKNKMVLILFLLLSFIVNMSVCCALTKKIVIKDEGVTLRSGAGTNYDVISNLDINSEYDFIDENIYKSESECENGWYKISVSDNTTGFVCSSNITIKEVKTCEELLKEKGFPDSYITGLCTLSSKHPNWIFTPIQTNLDFEEAVSKESACGKSYIATSNQSYIDSSCKNQYTSTWYPASNEAVAKYMDPRNWFKEEYIFQFEKLSYNNLLTEIYAGAASYSIRNAAFYKYHLNIGNDLGVVINSVGVDTNVSPVFLSSRMLQELGSKETLYNLYSGVYSGNDGVYIGYYNFYNIGVSDSCATTYGTTICGLKYAYNNGWNSLYNSIKGGASQIYNNYIAAGQYSGYFQKFNLAPTNPSRLYLHQYMTNIAAPSSESKTTYNAYKNQNILDNAFEFYIPVFNNVDTPINNEDNGATGDTSTDTQVTEIDIDTIITGSGYTRNGEFLYGVKPSTNVSTLKSSIESIAGSNTVLVKNNDGNALSDGLVGTGFKLEISNANSKKEVTIIIKGDTSGDGNINALDLLQVQKKILGTYTLEGPFSLAGDTSSDGSINALDLLQVQKSILGTYTIE